MEIPCGEITCGEVQDGKKTIFTRDINTVPDKKQATKFIKLHYAIRDTY